MKSSGVVSTASFASPSFISIKGIDRTWKLVHSGKLLIKMSAKICPDEDDL